MKPRFTWVVVKKNCFITGNGYLVQVLSLKSVNVIEPPEKNYFVVDKVMNVEFQAAGSCCACLNYIPLSSF